MKTDRLKEELSALKLFFGALLAINVSVIAWLAQNFRKGETIVVWGASLVFIGFSGLLISIILLIYSRLDRLEKC